MASVITPKAERAQHSDARYQARATAVPLLALALDPIHIQRTGTRAMRGQIVNRAFAPLQ